MAHGDGSRVVSGGPSRANGPWTETRVPQRFPLFARLILGALMLALGLITWSDPTVLSSYLREHPGWQSAPLIGGLQPIEIALIVALGRFTAGVFLLGGFITRGMTLLALLISLFLVWVGADLMLLNLLAVALAVFVLVFGGGGRTLDSVLGKMQRRSIEKDRMRQAEREAARRAQQGG